MQVSEAMATPSYERQTFSSGLTEVARAGSALEWQEWLNAGDWQRQAGFDRGSLGAGTLRADGGGALAAAAAAAAAVEATSLSQQQLHTQSTAREFGPRALGLFRQSGSRSSQRASNGRRSASPTLMRVGYRGRMQQRATSVLSAPTLAKMNQGEWGAVLMQQSKGQVPQAIWRGNRRLASADGRSPALVPLGQRSRRATPVTEQQQQRAKRQEALRQRRLQKQQKRQLHEHQQHQQSPKVPSAQLQVPATGATVSVPPPEDNSTHHGSGPQSAATFDDGYARQMARRSECALLVKEGDMLIKQYANRPLPAT